MTIATVTLSSKGQVVIPKRIRDVNRSLPMRLLTTTLPIVLASSVLVSCSQQDTTIDVDPELGQDCFELRRTTLPVGTQYEGIEGADADKITLRIMDGTGVTTVECGLEPDGTLTTK